MFKFDRTDKNTLKLTVDEDDMNGAGVSFEATASVTRDADDAVDSLTLSLGTAGLVINGSDDVDTTLKMVAGADYILKVGGDGNLFSAAINAVVVDNRTGVADADKKDMNLTIGLNLKGIGYGVVPKVGVTQITESNFGDLFSNTNLSISVE